jgi:hypothetical protein
MPLKVTEKHNFLQHFYASNDSKKKIQRTECLENTEVYSLGKFSTIVR